MARFYTLRIGDIYITEDGLVSGIPCKLKISPVESLRNNYAGQTAPSADGTPYTVAFLVGTKGRPLSIEIETVLTDVFDDLVDLINGAIQNNLTITLTGVGDFGDFSLEAVPTLPTPISSSGEFINGRLKKVVLNFTTAS